MGARLRSWTIERLCIKTPLRNKPSPRFACPPMPTAATEVRSRRVHGMWRRSANGSSCFSRAGWSNPQRSKNSSTKHATGSRLRPTRMTTSPRCSRPFPTERRALVPCFHRDLAETFREDDVALRVLDSGEEKSMPIGREAASPDGEQAGQVGDLADMLAAEVEVLEGIVPWAAGEEVGAAACQNPGCVSGHSGERALVTATGGNGPGVAVAALIFVEQHPGSIECFLRSGPARARAGQADRGSAFDWHLPNGVRRFRREIDGVAVRRPERTRGIGRPGQKPPWRPSIDVHDVEFGVAGSAQVEDDVAAVR